MKIEAKPFSELNIEKLPDGLVPAIIQDDRTLKVLMLGYMNREAYEKGMAEARDIGERREDGDKGGEHRSTKAKGTVTVSYAFSNPVRHHRSLIKPAYKCESGGDVEVSVTVNRNGEVIAASIVYGGDECMRSMALKAARESLFDINPSAPARQTGTITYVFIPQ